MNEILKDFSVNMDYKASLWRLRKFFEIDNRQKILEDKLDSKLVFNSGKKIEDGEKCVNTLKINKMAKSFFNFINSFEKDIAHAPKINGNPATQFELEIFFDFGLSLARMIFV